MLDLLAAAGHPLRDVLERWTPAMIVRLAEAAGRRRRFEWVMAAQIIAAGVGAGFSGDLRPIEALAKSLGVPFQRGAGGARPPDVRDLLSRVYSGGVDGGAHGRRTRGPARSEDR